MGENLYVRSMLGILDELYIEIFILIRQRNNDEMNNGISSILTIINNQNVVDAVNMYKWHFDTFSRIAKETNKDEIVRIRRNEEGKHYLLYGSDEEE